MLLRSNILLKAGKFFRLSFLLVALFITLTSCVSDIGISTVKRMAPPEQFASEKSLPNQGGCWPTTDWAKDFQDPQLPALIEEALANNPSLEAAQARVLQAEALSDNKASLLFPSLNWRGEADGGHLPPALIPRTLRPFFGGSWFTLGLFVYRLKYNLDIWGKNLALLKQALDLEKVNEVTEQESRLSIATAVASTYNQLTYYYALRNVLRRTVAQREKLARVYSIRLQTGLDPRVPIYQSRNQVASARVALKDTEGQIRLTRQQLGTLLGGGPDRGFKIKQPRLIVTKTPRLPSNIPLHLLGRRPDIVAAIWRVNASCEGVANVKAQFYPDVNIAALGGFAGFDISRLFNAESAGYQIGPVLTLPIFDAGALRSQLRQQYAYYEEVVANYNDTLNNALMDVASQLTNIKANEKQLKAQKEALIMAQRAYNLARKQFSYGLASQLVALDAQTQLLTEEQNRLKLLFNRRNLQIALIKSLGGGFCSPVCIVHKKTRCCC